MFLQSDLCHLKLNLSTVLTIGYRKSDLFAVTVVTAIIAVTAVMAVTAVNAVTAVIAVITVTAVTH